MAVGNDGCRWENDILCGGTQRSPLQPNKGDAPGNGAHSQQQQEKLTPYELEKKNAEDNEVQPTIFSGGTEHTTGDEKSTVQVDEPSLDDSRNHTKKLKSKYTGCRWENDVHCGGTAAFPGGGTATAPPTKAEIAAAKKAQQEKPTPYELEMENEKDNEVKPTIFDIGGSPPEHSIDDGHHHKKTRQGHQAHPRRRPRAYCEVEGGGGSGEGAQGGEEARGGEGEHGGGGARRVHGAQSLEA
jgi:hypothetical protein